MKEYNILYMSCDCPCECCIESCCNGCECNNCQCC